MRWKDPQAGCGDEKEDRDPLAVLSSDQDKVPIKATTSSSLCCADALSIHKARSVVSQAGIVRQVATELLMHNESDAPSGKVLEATLSELISKTCLRRSGFTWSTSTVYRPPVIQGE